MKIRPLLLLLIAHCFALSLSAAVTKAQADSAYLKKDYAAAARLYEQVLKQGVAPDVYYNLGNAYYRLNDAPRAILNYERALKLEPGHADAAYNLDVCRTKLSVSEGQPSEMFFITWTNDLIRSRSIDAWALAALFSFVLALAMWSVGRLAAWLWLRRSANVLMPVFAVAFIFSIVSATLQHSRFRNEVKAVVMNDTGLSADKGGAAAVLRAGTTVLVLDESPDGRRLVETADKRHRGWVEGKSLTKV